MLGFEPLMQVVVQYAVLLKRLFNPKNVAFCRFSKNMLGQIQIVAVIGIEHNGLFRPDGLTYSPYNGNVARCSLVQRHVARPAAYFDFERAMAGDIALTGFVGNQVSGLFSCRQMQVVNLATLQNLCSGKGAV